MAKLRILHAPGYGPRANKSTLRRIKNTRVDSAGTSEAYRIAHLFGYVDGYTGISFHSPTSTRRVQPSLSGDAGDNPMLVRDDHLLLSSRVSKLTDPGQPRRLTPERWGYQVRYEWDDKIVCHINLHMSVRWLHPWRWKQEWKWARSEVLSARRHGEYVVVTGDLNTRSAGKQLRELGLKVWRIGVDYLAFDERLFRGNSRSWTPPNTDHPWMRADLFTTKEEATA